MIRHYLEFVATGLIFTPDYVLFQTIMMCVTIVTLVATVRLLMHRELKRREPAAFIMIIPTYATALIATPFALFPLVALVSHEGDLISENLALTALAYILQHFGWYAAIISFVALTWLIWNLYKSEGGRRVTQQPVR